MSWQQLPAVSHRGHLQPSPTGCCPGGARQLWGGPAPNPCPPLWRARTPQGWELLLLAQSQRPLVSLGRSQCLSVLWIQPFQHHSDIRKVLSALSTVRLRGFASGQQQEPPGGLPGGGGSSRDLEAGGSRQITDQGRVGDAVRELKDGQGARVTGEVSVRGGQEGETGQEMGCGQCERRPRDGPGQTGQPWWERPPRP